MRNLLRSSSNSLSIQRCPLQKLILSKFPGNELGNLTRSFPCIFPFAVLNVDFAAFGIRYASNLVRGESPMGVLWSIVSLQSMMVEWPYIAIQVWRKVLVENLVKSGLTLQFRYTDPIGLQIVNATDPTHTDQTPRHPRSSIQAPCWPNLLSNAWTSLLSRILRQPNSKYQEVYSHGMLVEIDV